MCPCDFCFPDEGENNSEGHCYSNCKHSFVSCPLIETAMQTSDSTENRKDDSFNIIQQPADLLTLTDKYTQWSIEFIENSINEKKPFFLYLAYQQTHHPVFAGTIMISFVVNLYFVFSLKSKPSFLSST